MIDSIKEWASTAPEADLIQVMDCVSQELKRYRPANRYKEDPQVKAAASAILESLLKMKPDGK